MKKRATLYSLCATVVAVCGLFLGAAPASASIHNTPGYFHIANAGSGKCIDASYSGDPQQHDSAQQWRCLNTAMEEWAFQPVNNSLSGRTDLFQIASNATGECLGYGGFYDGVKLTPCDNWREDTHWFFGNHGQDSSGPYFQLRNRTTGQCLDLENGDPSDGVPMQVWDCNPNTYNQRWRQL